MKGHLEEKHLHRVRTLFFCSCVLLLNGCGIFNGLLEKVGLASPAPDAAVPAIPIPLSEQPYEVALTIIASDDINPDVQARPSPAKTRIFLTTPDVDLKAMPIEKIFELGDLQMEQKPAATITLRPGTQSNIKLNGNKSQTRLTIAVAYREPYRTQWIESKTIDNADRVNISVRVTSLAVKIGPSP